MNPKKYTLTLIALWLLGIHWALAQNQYYFPKTAATLDPKIPTPEAFLGYPIGSFYTRHDQVVNYFNKLAQLSNRVHVQTIGKTNENREQVVVTITSPENYNRLEQIRQEHLNQIDPSKPAVSNNAPVIVYLGYGVHGNETSSTEASLLTGYFLAASNDLEAQKWLNEAVIFIEPSLNPDGRDRAANWHNAYHSEPPVSDPADKEHQEQWPAGRTNHYFTDLNRDWLNLVQVESRNRVAFFHQWYPNVQIDFHEQGTNATYYFEPTPANHYSPIIPSFLYEENIVLAKYNAKALDDIGSLYFTKEGYDNLSPIYGSTYPKFYGAVAATYEQASSRGIEQESSNGVLTFKFTIRNHLTTSFSTIRAAVEEKTGLFKVQKDFFQYALEQGRKSTAKGYVFGDSKDANLTQKFLDLLLQHHLQVYKLDNDLSLNGKKFQKDSAYFIPADQPNYLVVHSIFEENTLKDSIYYDNTGWSIIHAYGLQYTKLTSSLAKNKLVTELNLPVGGVDGGKAQLAYLLDYTDYNASRALYHLLTKKVLVKSAYKPFAANTAIGKRYYGAGSLVIPINGQSLSSDSLYRVLQEIATEAHLHFAAVHTGYSVGGIDLGSNNIRAIRTPNVAVAFGQGVTASEAGQIWFLLNKQLDLPITKLDLSSFSRTDLARYNTLVLPGGAYNDLDKATVESIKDWVNKGGTLITFQSASAWAIQQGIVKEQLANNVPFSGRDGARNNTEENKEKEKPKENKRLDYARQEEVEGARRVNGAIFEADLDITNPIAYGISSRKLYINKNGSTVLLPSANPYATVAQYTAKPFVNGYAPKKSLDIVANSAAIITSSSGRGNVVLFADDPTYRGYWLGTSRIFLNSLFFTAGGAGRRGGAEE